MGPAVSVPPAVSVAATVSGTATVSVAPAAYEDELDDFPLLPPGEPLRGPAVMPAPVVVAPPPPPPEPAWKARDWSQEALPTPQAGRSLEAEEEVSPNDLDDDGEPNPLARAWHLLRNDPYIAVMAGLGLIIFVLLLVFLLLRK
jgi:hypothetical protein